MPPPLRLKALTCLLLILLPAAPAVRAQPPPELLPPQPTTAGPIITDTAVPVPEGSFAVQPYWSLGFTRGKFTGSWRRVSAGGDYVSLEIPVKFTYGLYRNLEVDLTVPYVHNWASRMDTPVRGARAADFGGLGDLVLTAKYQLLEETPQRPVVTALATLNLPTGHQFPLNPGNLGTDSLGGGSLAVTLGVNLSKWINPFNLYANVWYGVPTSFQKHGEDRLTGPILRAIHGQDRITVNLAAEWVLSPRWAILLEFYSLWEVGPLFARQTESPSALAGLLPGLEYIISPQCSLALGAALDLAGKNTDCRCTPTVTVVYNF